MNWKSWKSTVDDSEEVIEGQRSLPFVETLVQLCMMALQPRRLRLRRYCLSCEDVYTGSNQHIELTDRKERSKMMNQGPQVELECICGE